jgi:hypothetical protein
VAPIEPVWLFGAIALLCGVFLGMLINRKMNPSVSDNNQLKADLDAARTEMERYKSSVNSHFNKTSDLVNELTQDYVKVYRHLAEGAQTLSDTREFTQVLDQPQGQVLITVEDSSNAAAEVDAPVDEPVDKSVEPAVSADTEATASPQPEDAEAVAASAAEPAEDPVPVEIVDYDKSQNAATDSTSEVVAEEVDKKAANSADIDAHDKIEAAGQEKSAAAEADKAPAESAKTAEADTADSEPPKKA